MPIDLTAKTLVQLKTLIENHERLGRTDAPLYLATKAELTRRSSGKLEVGRTVEIIADYARKSSFLSYGQIAKESGIAAGRANILVPKHLEAVNAWAKQHELPMLSAIVVTKQHLVDGKMDVKTLAGFIASVEKLGVSVEGEPAAFLAREQAAVFQAAKEGRLA